MRTIILCDNTIPEEEMQETLAEFKKIYKKVGIDCTFDIQREDMSDLPFDEYRNNSLGITKSYLKSRANALKAQYNYRYDFVLFWVAHNHYKPQKQNIWGWAVAGGFYEILQCRFETRKGRSKENIIANSLGTLYHEMMHTHDSTLFRYKRLHAEDYVGLPRGMWDDCVVHGKCGGYKYIGRENGMENQEALEAIAPYLKKALQVRKDRHQTHISIIQKLIDAYLSLIVIIKKSNYQ